MRPVFWSMDAHQDNLKILRHIAEDNPLAAERVVDAIEDAGRRLGIHSTGRPGRVSGTFEKSVPRSSFIIAYELREIEGRESVVILRVIHMARNWPADAWPPH